MLATFFIQITFMNMLIAVMSNIFDQVMATEEQSRMKARLELLQDLEGVLKFFRRGDKKKNYLLIVKPKIMREDESLEAKVDSIKTFMEE